MHDDFLMHYGKGHLAGGHSGRYEWGSGANPNQHQGYDFLNSVAQMRKEGMTETEIAKAMGMTTTEYRQKVSISSAKQRAADVAMVERLKSQGLSRAEIARQMNKNESTIRSLENEASKARAEVTNHVANALKEQVDAGSYIDIGVGSETMMQVSQTKLQTAVKTLEEQGYVVKNIQVDQLGTAPGNKTTIKVLAPPGTTTPDIYNNTDLISVPNGKKLYDTWSSEALTTPKSISSDRIEVRFAEDGGLNKDGVIELRRGVDDISLGNAKYAQVRIMVDDRKYLKGMAVYSDDLPDGVDIRFNTNKSKEVGKMGAMKDIKNDPNNPFGASIKSEAQLIRAQKFYIDKDGKKQQSVINVVNEEGNWEDWSKTLSSQMLSKQSPALAKQQLDIAYEKRANELKSIKELTNPAVKKYMLDNYAETCDAAASHLKAAALPRQRTQVILPIQSLKDNEVYAPNFKQGESVVLIRFPHGGKFEIPELTVNNRNKEGKSILGTSPIDAIGINSKVAARLSGADFDGDTVLVIPNNSGAVKTEKAFAALEVFDPHISYKAYEGMPKVTNKNFNKGREMGSVSNLITDMTIKGASNDEICRAVKHSMVIIDAEKHNLNWRQSAIDNGIPELKAKYQGGANRGASTLISKASAEERPLARKEITYLSKKGIETGKYTSQQIEDFRKGKKIFEYTGETYTDKNGKTQHRRTSSDKMAEVSNAYELASGKSKESTTRIERVYAEYANGVKALANEARRESRSITYPRVDKEAKKLYAKEVASLDAKLKLAISNKPLERQAQLAGNARYRAILKENPGMDAAEKSKKRAQCLDTARVQVGAKKTPITITNREWEAIQAHAISYNQLNTILLNSDSEAIKQLATPISTRKLSATQIANAKQRLSRGYTTEEVAEILGVSVTTLINAVND